MQLMCPACFSKNRVPSERLLEEPICGRCGADLMPLTPIALEDGNFTRYLEGSEMPVLVDFWAAWCGPCQAMAPAFAQVAKQQALVRFAKVDTDAQRLTASKAAIRSIPTLILFEHGLEKARVSGALSASALSQWLQSHLTAHAKPE